MASISEFEVTDQYTSVSNDSENDNDDNSNFDSAIGLSRSNSTGTVLSDIFEPTRICGRGFHSFPEAEYLMPNDSQEQKRLDVQHDLFLVTTSGSLYLASPPACHRVLDIGTGTGIWAIEFAEKNPTAEVCGVDLSPIQPGWVPPNCEFQISDLSLPWTFSPEFNFIHGRMLFCAFSNPVHVFREAFNALVTDGVLEMQDVIFEFRSNDDSLRGSTLEIWSQKLKDAFLLKHIDLTCTSKYRDYFKEVGFKDIQQKEFVWPVGNWSKTQDFQKLGKLCQQNVLEMLFGISVVPLTQTMSMEEVELLLVEVRKDLYNPSIHAYLQIVFIHGRKPSITEEFA